MKYRSLLALALLAALPAVSHADIIACGAHADYPVIDGASLSDVRMSLAMNVHDGIATLEFANASTGLETSAVLDEIVLRTIDESTGQALLWEGKVLTDTKDVAFDLGASNGLAGYTPLMQGEYPLAELGAKPSPIKRGLGLGESLKVQFETSLGDGATEEDYINAFADSDFVIGFHAISADVVNGQSLSGASVPEPATIALLGVGGSVLIWRRRRR